MDVPPHHQANAGGQHVVRQAAQETFRQGPGVHHPDHGALGRLAVRPHGRGAALSRQPGREPAQQRVRLRGDDDESHLVEPLRHVAGGEAERLDLAAAVGCGDQQGRLAAPGRIEQQGRDLDHFGSDAPRPERPQPVGQLLRRRTLDGQMRRIGRP